ncbi:MAG: cell division protein ZapD [Gammaproteobacteria bacterium]|nr:cell division protein ZapD [Gammaproteobacteria bacterium]
MIDNAQLDSQSPITVSDKIIFEHPLNEKTRTFLRLEHLFAQVIHYLPGTDTWSSRAAVDGLLDIVSIFGRGDIKADLIKELGRQQSNLNAIRQIPNIDHVRLEQIVSELEQINGQINTISGQIGQALRSDEFLKTISQRTSIPGGSCDFDLPAFYYWLEQPHEQRGQDIKGWIQTVEPVRAAINLIMSMIRGSTRPTAEQAPGGFFQRTLDPKAPVQLLRVGLPRESHLFAEFSGGKHRFTIRFMETRGHERPAQCGHDVSFFLNCCIL